MQWECCYGVNYYTVSCYSLQIVLWDIRAGSSRYLVYYHLLELWKNWNTFLYYKLNRVYYYHSYFQTVSHFILFTTTTRELLACDFALLTNRGAVQKVTKLQVAMWLVKRTEARCKCCPCRQPLSTMIV